MLHPFPSWQGYQPSDPVPEHDAHCAEAYMSEEPVSHSYSHLHCRIRNEQYHRHDLHENVHDHDLRHEYAHEYESYHLHGYVHGCVHAHAGQDSHFHL